MTNIFYNNIGQTILEIALAISLAIILVVGVISSWNWFNRTMVERFETYNASRLAAIHDIRDSQFGMKLSYNRPNLNLFSSGSSIKDAPPAVGVIELIEGIDYDACYNALNASLAVVNQTRYEIILLDEQINNITVDIMELKNDLGTNENVWRSCWGIPSLYGIAFMSWIYGEDESEKFFENTFSEIITQLNTRILEKAFSGCSVVFFPAVSTTNLIRKYIIPGIRLESQGATKAGERKTKQESADKLESEAWTNFSSCVKEQEQQDPCYLQCKNFDDRSKQLAADAQEALGSGAFGQAEDLYNQSEQAGVDYDNCYRQCKMQDPCYANCYNTYGLPAQQALEQGRSEDYMNLIGQFDDCLEGC